MLGLRNHAGVRRRMAVAAFGLIRRPRGRRALAAPDNLHYSAQYADRGTVPTGRRAFTVEN